MEQIRPAVPTPLLDSLPATTDMIIPAIAKIIPPPQQQHNTIETIPITRDATARPGVELSVDAAGSEYVDE